ncbi:predicted protein [Plenodomus lingam JN3]|uniref:Predicted protein n=1 Tax=Leptosphaeria maculans (strain JN3 / isolate v23.1.3 / race Av1-4-5-6-7-8) TaxID=985895 RepID=E5A8J8_LEPMJ|nr:predicted protein [Plenodomus lingam JN3]CBX99943.1 predicted protein [Plenodomus lingam JN3]
MSTLHERDLHTGSFVSANPEVVVLPLTIRKTTHPTQTSSNTQTHQDTTNNRNSNFTSINRVHRKPVAGKVTNSPPRVVRPTSCSAQDGRWAGDTITAVLHAPVTLQGRGCRSSVAGFELDMSKCGSIMHSSSKTASPGTIEQPPKTHPSCLRPGVHILRRSCCEDQPEYLVPPHDRLFTASSNEPPPLHIFALVRAPVTMPPPQHVREFGMKHDIEDWLSGIPRYDYFVDGRPLVESIWTWREVMHWR